MPGTMRPTAPPMVRRSNCGLRISVRCGEPGERRLQAFLNLRTLALRGGAAAMDPLPLRERVAKIERSEIEPGDGSRFLSSESPSPDFSLTLTTGTGASLRNRSRGSLSASWF